MEQIDSKKILYGAHIGEHGYELDALTDEIKRLCIARGMNFVTIRMPRVSQPIPEKYLIDWAKFCADNKIYFIYLYTLQHALHFKGTERKSFLTREVVAQIKKVAGEYYMGDMLGELGSVWVGKLPGYYVEGHPPMLKQDAEDMEIAKEYFKSAVQDYLQIERELGIDKVCVTESSMIVTYGLEAGIDFALAELMPRDPERMIGIFRGTMKSFNTGIWGAYFAHEWYAGRFHDDMIKRKRLELEYKMAYMNGAGVLCHESGDDVLCAALSSMTMLIINAIEVSFASNVEYTIDEKTTDIKLVVKSAIPKYEKDEKKQYAAQGLIQAYFFQLMDLVEDYYEYLDVKEIVREI